MPLSWQFLDESIVLGGTFHPKTTAKGKARRVSFGIAREDSERQTHTARGVIERLNKHPGAILADEVGMGKTYVALAVVGSVLAAERRSGNPVVVMVPPGLITKWRNEWEQFKTLCVKDGALDWVRAGHANNPTAFFKLLDDPIPTRMHLIFVATNCFHAGFTDRWIKLAFVRSARSRTRMTDEMKQRLYRWVTDLLRMKGADLRDELIERLLSSDLTSWKDILIRNGFLDPGADDPIPEQLVKHVEDLNFDRVVEVIRSEQIPTRTSTNIRERLKQARDALNRACDSVYWEWLRQTSWRAPLLVLDEAHHAKNDGTRLAGLFRSEETASLLDGQNPTMKPFLWEKFDRMLFLTATPFQLGHDELVRILRSFGAAHWKRERAPAGTRQQFTDALNLLKERLDQNRQYSKQLDEWWGQLERKQFEHAGSDEELAKAVASWWAQTQKSPQNTLEANLVQAVSRCIESRGAAEHDPEHPWSSLRTWVIRHNRARHLPHERGEPQIDRRDKRVGASLTDQGTLSNSGLPLSQGAALPFLLAVRAQGELAAGSARARAFFAEGLCSSYEAFHHTRDNRGDARDADDDGVERDADSKPPREKDRSLVPVEWYENKVAALIPCLDAPAERRFNHPKIRPVVEKVVNLWERGEKVLLFCFYRQTARALLSHLKTKTERRILELAADKMGLEGKRDTEIRSALDRVIRRLSEPTSTFHRKLEAFFRRLIEQEEYALLAPYRARLLEMLVAYARSPAFLCRYLPLELPEVREALAEGQRDPRILERGADALIDAIEHREDESRTTTQDRLEEFLLYAKELAERSSVRVDGDGAFHSLLDQYLEAVAVYSSARRSSLDDDEDVEKGDDGSYRVLPVVRMVYGKTKHEARQRLMSAFNSPLFPEILVSSAVLGEGIDLHRFCRYVIHHDLCWNPSTLEQRTGRVDRIRCKAEYSRAPIVIYEPYIAGSADEKMFRVVQDRERWFQIVMGQKFEFDEATSEKIAARVPLPDALAKQLIFDLRDWKG
jgi:Helicase conserved C-terminal domain/SNF2-related domain